MSSRPPLARHAAGQRSTRRRERRRYARQGRLRGARGGAAAQQPSHLVANCCRRGCESMITLNRLGHSDEPFQLNPDMIVTVESTPDTVITLATGAKVVVAETPDGGRRGGPRLPRRRCSATPSGAAAPRSASRPRRREAARAAAAVGRRGRRRRSVDRAAARPAQPRRPNRPFVHGQLGKTEGFPATADVGEQ